tara:strand:- start:1313 stop:3370 length:2058 start_codon:yes stop_codon:yes gene_type:complete
MKYWLIAVLPLLITACGKPATVVVASLSGVAAASDVCERPATVEAEVNAENPLFQPLSIQPIKVLEPLLGNVRARQTTSLNGDWNTIVDQLGVGDASPLLRGGVGENDSYGPHELLEYSFKGQQTLAVPGDWNSQQASLFWYRGIVWYQKEFNYQIAAGKRVFLYFGGANFAKDVYVNGKLLLRHKGGFTPFNTEVTDYLKAGQNAIVVKVDSMSGPAEIPTEYNDWMNYGGITRDVMLVETPATFIRNYKLQLAAGSQDIVKGWLQLDGDNGAQTITLDIPEAGITKRFTTDSRGLAQIEFKAELAKWSPDSPKLYRVNWKVQTDSISDEIGFRSIETKGEDILLNGEKIFLRGVAMHEESLLRHGRAYNEADADAAILELKALNANFVRLAHYPHNEYIVRAADRAGIMVWAEMPVYHNIQFDNPCTLASAKQQYSELIDRDQNRAAVILWSLGNETPESEARNRFFIAMAKHVRERDDSRSLTAALLGFGGMEAIGRYIGTLLAGQKNTLIDLVSNPEPPIITINDSLGDIVDVLGYNEYFGWYLSGILTQEMQKQGLDVTEDQVRELMLQEMEKFTIVTPFNKPLVISEFGAGAKQGMRGGPLDVWTEDYQARVYRQQLKMLANSPALRGLSPWILKDFRAPYRLNTKIQNYWNRKGLISETGQKKLAFQVMSEYYLSLKK